MTYVQHAGLGGFGITAVATTLSPDDPNNPNRALYMDASNGGPAGAADGLNSGDPVAIQRAWDQLFLPPLGLAVTSTYQSFFGGPQGPQWLATLPAAAQAEFLSRAAGQPWLLTIQGKDQNQIGAALMARVTQAVGTAAGVWTDYTNAGIVVSGMGRLTMNADGTFHDDYGQTYTAAQVKALLAAANTPVVTQHVDTAYPVPDVTTPPIGWRQGTDAQGHPGWWNPAGLFFVGATPWTDPSAVGVTLAQASTPPAGTAKPAGTSTKGTLPLPTSPDYPVAIVDYGLPPGQVPTGLLTSDSGAPAMNEPGGGLTPPETTAPVTTALAGISLPSGWAPWAIGAAALLFLIGRRKS